MGNARKPLNTGNEVVAIMVASTRSIFEIAVHSNALPRGGWVTREEAGVLRTIQSIAKEQQQLSSVALALAAFFSFARSTRILAMHLNGSADPLALNLLSP